MKIGKTMQLGNYSGKKTLKDIEVCKFDLRLISWYMIFLGFRAQINIELIILERFY